MRLGIRKLIALDLNWMGPQIGEELSPPGMGVLAGR
jgi:hypothetical protein